MPSSTNPARTEPARIKALIAQAAASVDLPPPLFPFIGPLFDGIDALGSSPRSVVHLLRRAGIGQQHAVADLGCGKGAVAVAVSASLGCRVTGIDAAPEFLRSAQNLARRRRVDHLCTFRHGDALAPPGRARFDAAILIGVAPVETAASVLRRWVAPRGFYIIDDAFAAGPSAALLSAPDEIPTRSDIRARFTALGDTIITESVVTPSRLRDLNARLYARLAQNARRLARQAPRLRPHLSEFLRRQRRANDALAGPLRCAAWLVQRR